MTRSAGWGTGEPASKPDPTAVARAAKLHLDKTPVEKTSSAHRRPVPKTIDLSGPGSDVSFDEGLTLFEQGRFAQARVKLERCVAIAPNDFECHKLLGAVLDRLGDWKHAVRSYKEYLRLAPPGDGDIEKVQQLLELHEGLKQ